MRSLLIYLGLFVAAWFGLEWAVLARAEPAASTSRVASACALGGNLDHPAGAPTGHG